MSGDRSLDVLLEHADVPVRPDEKEVLAGILEAARRLARSVREAAGRIEPAG